MPACGSTVEGFSIPGIPAISPCGSLSILGSPVFPKRYFRALLEAFPEESDVTTVLHEGRPVASVLSFHFKQEVLPYYGGGTQEARGLAAADVMYWEVMRRAALDS